MNEKKGQVHAGANKSREIVHCDVHLYLMCREPATYSFTVIGTLKSWQVSEYVLYCSFPLFNVGVTAKLH